MAELLGGTDTYCIYGEESTFKTSVSPTAQFGSVDSVRVRKTRNIQEVHGMADGTTTGQLPRTHLLGVYEGTLSVTFKPVTFAWMKYVMGAVSGSGTGASPFSYTHAKKPLSLTISHNLDDSTDSRRRHAGAVCTSFQMRFAEGQAPVVTLDFKSATISKSTTLDSNVSIATGAEYNFDGCTLEAPDGSAQTHVIQSATIRVTRDVKFYYGASEIAATYIVRKTTIRLGITFLRKDEVFFENFTGSSTSISSLATFATIALKFTNGATKYVDFVFANCTSGTHDDNDTLNEPLGEEVEYLCRGLTVGERTTT